jgi:predicted TIM-barrel fold metal-dependent hydrolase
MPIWGTPFSEGHLARMMERCGIVRSIVSATIGNTCDFSRGNQQTHQVAGKGPFMGCLVVNTQYPAQAIEEMRKYLTSPNFLALLVRSGETGRLVPAEQCHEILNAHRRFLKPVMIQASDRDSVLQFAEVAKAFPGIKFVMLSMGGDAWRTAIDVAEKTLNIVLEVSGSLSPDKISMAAEVVGAHRMMYGSNLPFADPSVTIGLIEDADISDADKKQIFEGTAKKVFTWEK